MITRPRRSRIAVAGVPLHIIQRGNNRQTCFFSADDHRLYLGLLAQYAQESGCAIHAYVLVTYHARLLPTPAEPVSASRLLKRLGQRYVQSVNRCYQRSGTLGDGRYRSCIAQDEG
jgi:putative transposase